MSSRTIKETLVDLKARGYDVSSGFHGLPLKFEFATKEQVENNRVDELYQRLISIFKVNSYGECNLSLLIPSIISRRPEELLEYSGDFVIDGQNKEIIYANSGHEGDGENSGCPQMVMEHEYDPLLSKIENYKKVLKKEALLFQQLNTLRKKLTRLDELRAEVCLGDPVAQYIESVMNQLVVESDRFGSDKADAKTVKSFSQFYYTLTADYDISNDLNKCLSIEKIKDGYDLWTKIYGGTPSGAKVHGTAFRAICFLRRYLDEGLTNGIQKSLEKWCIEELAKQFSQDKLVKGFGSFDSPRWVLYRIIDKYNDLISNEYGTGAPTIRAKRMVEAVEWSEEERFKHPDEEVWKRIEKDAKT